MTWLPFKIIVWLKLETEKYLVCLLHEINPFDSVLLQKMFVFVISSAALCHSFEGTAGGYGHPTDQLFNVWLYVLWSPSSNMFPSYS